METKVECPKCHHTFELTDALAAPMIAAVRAEASRDLAQQVEEARRQIEADATARAQKTQADVVAAIKREAQMATDSERAMVVKLEAAQADQAKALKAQRELEEARRELELTVERRTAEGLASARLTAEQAVEERFRSNIAERDQTIASMARTVEELRRKAEQGSQQTQGEAQELALERALQERFPTDTITPVGKGISGGDCTQTINGAGTILYESKNTKTWSDGWLAKLRDDGRAAKADLLVIVTVALPKGVASFDQVEGVWVCSPQHAIPLAVALRQVLTEVASAKAAGEGVETKAGLIYQYMVGPRFKSRVSAIVEAFTSMREDLDAERRAITKQWSKREAQIERVLTGTVGMYGDLQAIAGKSLAEIEGLDIARLSA